ncbi:uncharacterized protein JCM15063_000921 [Sporobolomyces koalae]|uniref:uncharacterized protein n=1 Tax=Sporobolomyces koalae TaxID=500713 RepID=UPI003172A99B
MSGQVRASRSHHNLRTQHGPPAAHLRSNRDPRTQQEPIRHSRHEEYGQRAVDARARPPPAVDHPRSLRPVASSSNLPRQVYREEMPPPRVPTRNKHQAHGISSQSRPHNAGPPRHSPPRIARPDPEPAQYRARPKPPSPPTTRRPSSRSDDADHQAILERMRQNGWHGVGSSGTIDTRSDGMSHRSDSSTSSLTEDSRQSSSLSKIDSGFDEGDDRTAGEKVLEGWSALKKAVAGLAAGDQASHDGQGAQIWNRLTSTLAASVGTVNDAFNVEDDGSVGPDGETKLGRAIKTYHLSRIESVEQVPEWLLNDAEKARYERKALSHAHSTHELRRPPLEPSSSLHDRPVARQYHSEERLSSQPSSNGRIGNGASNPVTDLGPSRGSAADRLARMREERRLRANASVQLA